MHSTDSFFLLCTAQQRRAAAMHVVAVARAGERSKGPGGDRLPTGRTSRASSWSRAAWRISASTQWKLTAADSVSKRTGSPAERREGEGGGGGKGGGEWWRKTVKDHTRLHTTSGI